MDDIDPIDMNILTVYPSAVGTGQEGHERRDICGHPQSFLWVDLGYELKFMLRHSFAEQSRINGSWRYGIYRNLPRTQVLGKDTSYLVDGTFGRCLYQAVGHHGGLPCDIGGDKDYTTS